jgi:hypothetical protein
MVTLSLLIVVASLFSQVVSTIPSSPSSKCVEIFFFYVTLRLAVVFVHHALINHLISVQRSKSRKNEELSFVAQFFGKFSYDNSSECSKPAESKPKNHQEKIGDEDLSFVSSVNKVGYILGIVGDLIFAFVLIVLVTKNTNEKKETFVNGIVSPHIESIHLKELY